MTDKTYDTAVQEATFALARPGSLPKWLEIPALGRDMKPIAEIAVAAAYPIIAAALCVAEGPPPVDAPEPPAAAERRDARAGPGMRTSDKLFLGACGLLMLIAAWVWALNRWLP
jgi:hypothetical protein